jgi:peroxin-5
MKAWFTHNPKYAGMEMPPDIYGANSDPSNHESAFEEVKKLLLSALAFDSTDAGDIHEALGVIYNVIRDYNSATDSFRKALQLRPDDYQLWNKLGAVSVSFRVVRFFSYQI